MAPTSPATPSGSPTFTANQGYTGGSGKNIDSGFNPATAPSPKIGATSACIFAWTDQTAPMAGGLFGNGQGDTRLFPAYSDNNAYGGIFGTGGFIAFNPTPSAGFYLLNRTSGTAYFVDVNGSNYSNPTDAGISPPSANFISLEDGAGNVTTSTLAIFGFGGGLTSGDRTAIYSRLNTFMAGRFNTILAATAGSYTITGSPATLGGTATVLTAAAGSYTITGQAAALLRKQVAAAGSYTITGTAAALLRTQVAAAGSYTITGSAAAFVTTNNFVLAATAGSYAITGQPASFVATANLVFPAAAGAYTITGQPASLIVTANFVLPAAAGAYTVTGSAAAFITGGNYVLPTDPGAYTITGQPANIIAGFTTTLTAAAGSYTITGSPATLVASNKLTAAAGSYTITGSAAGLSPAPCLPQRRAATPSPDSRRRFVVTAIGPSHPSRRAGQLHHHRQRGDVRHRRDGRQLHRRRPAAPHPQAQEEEERRDELEELLELSARTFRRSWQPEPAQTGVSPDATAAALIDMAPQAPALMTSVGLTGTQRAIVRQGIVSDDEDDDEQAVTLLLELLS